MPEKCPNPRCKDGYTISAGGTFLCNTCNGSGTILSRSDLVEQITIQNELLLKAVSRHSVVMCSGLIHDIKLSIMDSGGIISQEKK